MNFRHMEVGRVAVKGIMLEIISKMDYSVLLRNWLTTRLNYHRNNRDNASGEAKE